MIRSSFRLNDMTRLARDRMSSKRKQNLLEASMTWHDAVVNQLTGEGTGREYNVPGTGQIRKVEIITRRGYRMRVNKRVGATTYTASAPGEAPASRLGQLRQSYRFRVTGPNYMEVGEVGSPLERALWLEKGTERIAARPHLQAAFEERRREIIAILRRRLI